MKELRRQTRKALPLAALLALAAVAAAVTGCGGGRGGGSSEKQYTLAGRVVNGNPYHNLTEPRPRTKVIITRSAETFVLPNGVTNERYEPYTEMIADGDGKFSVQVPAGLYELTTVPPPGGDPNDGIETPDDICANFEIIRFPPHEDEPQGLGQNVILGHDFCNLLPVTD